MRAVVKTERKKGNGTG